MAFDIRRKEMLDHFNTSFSGVPFTQIVWDGVINKSIDKDNAWITVTIQPAAANFASLNSVRRVRHVGLFTVQIFIKPGETTEVADDLVESIASVIEGDRTSNGIIFGATTPYRVGIIDGYYQINTATPYKYDDLR